MTQAPDRPSWDDYFMQITVQVARRSTCPRAAVGAVIVRDKRILTTGYNGAPSGLPHCTEVGCLMVNGHCVRTLHAEQNAIIQGALHGVDVSASTLYVTHQPCLICAKMIINAGIDRVVYAGDYPDEIACNFLEQAGVEMIRYEPAPGQNAADSPAAPDR
jgi:dCMP deaminase